MSAAIQFTPPDSGPPLPRKRFTRDEVNHLLDTGFFVGQRFELIDGDLIDKMGQKPAHARAIQRMMVLLIQSFGVDRVRVQLPIEAGFRDRKWNQPEPDLAVATPQYSDAEMRHPEGNELTLVVEVADTSLRYDATGKRDLYARAGVQEYWLVDINSRRLLVHSNLAGDQYAEVLMLNETDVVPHVNALLSAILG